MGKAAKRQRKNKTDDLVADTKKATPPIASLPFELIAEVLHYSKSPADLLSLSRTCRHFHATLVLNPAATFIWKRVRAQTMPPVPDPTKLGFSEPQLANFIYGGGKCTVCLLFPRFVLFVPTFCSRNAENLQATCMPHSPPGFAYVGTLSVAKDIRQSNISAAMLLISQTSKGKPCLLLLYSPTRVVATLDRMFRHRPK